MSDTNKIILDTVQPIVHTYNHYAHMISILGCHKETFPWIYSNFIQVFMNKELSKHSWGDYYFPFPYEIKAPDLCKWIIEGRVKRKNFINNENKLIDFIKGELSENCYLYMYINHNYLHFPGIGSENKCHDALIYGIDCDEQIIYVADVFNYGKYERKKIPFSDFIPAFYQCKLEPENDFMNDMIYTYEVKRQCNYEFNKNNIEYAIRQYYESRRPEYWNMYNQSNAPDIVFGMEVYKSLSLYLDHIISKRETMVDATHFYLMKEHKEVMVKRLEFMCQEGSYQIEQMKDVIRSYQEIEERFQSILFKIIKYVVIPEESLIKKAKEELLINEALETEALKRYFDAVLPA